LPSPPLERGSGRRRRPARTLLRAQRRRAMAIPRDAPPLNVPPLTQLVVLRNEAIRRRSTDTVLASKQVNLLKHRRFPLVCVILALLVALPHLAAGFYLDDYVHIAFLEKKGLWNPAWWDLYRFTPDDRGQLEALVAKGMFPWWTIPTLKIHFFR